LTYQLTKLTYIDRKNQFFEKILVKGIIKKRMEFHPKDLPVSKTYDLKDIKDASDAVEDMVKLGFSNRKEGFRVLMPKESKLAKRIGHTVTTGVTYGLRQKKEIRDIKYWTYHYDENHYAIVLISSKGLTELGF
jgi:hypothetical protein